jgi:hypothetical protein
MQRPHENGELDDLLRAQESARMAGFLADIDALRGDWERVGKHINDAEQLELPFTFPHGLVQLYGAPLVEPVQDIYSITLTAPAGPDLGLILVPMVTIAVVVGAIVAALL